jgi:hypothetical protein
MYVKILHAIGMQAWLPRWVRVMCLRLILNHVKRQLLKMLLAKGIR